MGSKKQRSFMTRNADKVMLTVALLGGTCGGALGTNPEAFQPYTPLIALGAGVACYALKQPDVNAASVPRIKRAAVAGAAAIAMWFGWQMGGMLNPVVPQAVKAPIHQLRAQLGQLSL